MKRVLVTGGAGFIGSHLCARLLKEGNYVICLDNFFTGQKINIEPLMGNPNFELMVHDVIDLPDIPVAEIYNLACPASPIHYQYNPINTLRTSLWGAYNALTLAMRYNAKILQASTSEVYGDPSISPQQEDYWGHVNPIGPRSCYDEGKRAAETFMVDFHKHRKVRSKIIRIFNTYGPNMSINDGRVVSNFIIQALQNQDITIYGDGLQSRSFQYVDDLIEAMIRVMNDTPDDFIGPINIGNPREFTMLELAKMVLEKIPESTSKIVYEPLPQDDPRQRRPDIELAKRMLHWEPKILLSDGLDKTIEYLRHMLELREQCKRM